MEWVKASDRGCERRKMFLAGGTFLLVDDDFVADLEYVFFGPLVPFDEVVYRDFGFFGDSPGVLTFLNNVDDFLVSIKIGRVGASSGGGLSLCRCRCLFRRALNGEFLADV